MTTSRSRLLLLAVGLLTAGPASAATLTVYAKMNGPNAVGRVAPVSGTTTINCFTNSPANCVDGAATGAIVLEATSQTNAAFVSWVGCAAVSGAQCTLDLTTNKTVTANFAASSQTLTAKTYPIKTATFTPAFGGRLQAPTTPAIDCGRSSATADVTACTAPASGTVVITAVPLAGSKVTSWSGCAPLTATTCQTTMNAAKLVSATFGPLNVPITVQKNGTGTVNSATSASVTDVIACGADCSGQVVPGQDITLVAVPPSGGVFVGWTGCSSATTTCTLTGVSAPVTVTATFKSTTCAACHGLPPASTHAAFSGGCAECHTGYSNANVNPSLHMNNAADFGPNNKVYAPAGFGFNLELVAFQPFGDAAFPRGYVDIRATDGASATLDILGLINTCATYSGSMPLPPCDGSNRTPRISIGQIQPDGSFKPALRGSTATAVASSETMAASRLTDLGGGVFRYQPQYGFLAALPYDAAFDYRAVVYGGRYFKTAGQSSIGFYSTDYADLQGTGTVRADATVNDSKCNACHGKLTLHGMRRGVNVCLTCHNINLPLGTGNTDAFKWDLKNLAHKLHSGLNYDGINPMTGASSTTSPWGTTMDASHMAMGPSHQTYFEGSGTATTTTTDDAVHQLPTQIQCFVCHDETATNHLVASRAGCSSCHPINWVTGAGHGASYPTVLPGETHAHPEASDDNCATCHPQTGPVVADFTAVPPVMSFPVATVHSALWEPKTGVDFGRSFQFQGTGEATPTTVSAVPTVDGVQRHKLEVNVTGFSVSSTTGRATIEFTVLLDGAPYSELLAARAGGYAGSTESKKAAFPTCAFTLAGPAGTDYVVPATGSNNLSCGSSGDSAVVAVSAAEGRYSVMPTTNLNTATYQPGTYTLSYEMMYSRQGGTPTTGLVRKPFAAKPSFYTVTKATGNTWSFANGSPRRAVVSFDKCNACHVQVGFHSNQGRQGPDYCAVCHNPMLDNGTRDRVKFAAARNPADYGSYLTTQPGVDQKVYLVESVSTNIFIHRIHMGSELPSVQDAAQASPWVPEPGRIFYGATRSNFIGATSGAYTSPTNDTVPPSITDLSNFAMPNPIGRCNQCHLDNTWAAPESANRAPIVRKFKLCAGPVVPAFESTDWEGDGVTGEEWCAITSTSGPTTLGTLYTPPVKAVCTSCHDDIATDAHADDNTVNPMSATAVEGCATCHGDGAPWNALTVHPNLP